MDLNLRKEIIDFLEDICADNYFVALHQNANTLIDKINRNTNQNTICVRGLYIPKAKLDEWIKSIKDDDPTSSIHVPRLKAINEARISYSLSLKEAKALIDGLITLGY